MVASFPWEITGVDFVGTFSRTPRGTKYILLFINYFTKCVVICLVQEATAQVTANKFLCEVFASHSAPKHLVSDRCVACQ